MNEEGPSVDAAEMQAKATIAAALIVSRAVELPTMPRQGQHSHDEAVMRLRDLTEYVFQVIAAPKN
jgi:hypothetical protein